MKENLAAGFQSKLLSADIPHFQLAWVVSSRTHPARRASGQGEEQGREGEQKQGSSVDLILPFPSFAPNTPCLSLPLCQTGRLMLQTANYAPSSLSPCSAGLCLPSIRPGDGMGWDGTSIHRTALAGKELSFMLSCNLEHCLSCSIKPSSLPSVGRALSHGPKSHRPAG